MKRTSETMLAPPAPVRAALQTPGRPLERPTQAMLESTLSRATTSARSSGPAEPFGVTSKDDVHEREAEAGSRGANPALASRATARDFSKVRVHTDAAAAESARALGARAFTVGNHIVFGGGEFAPQQESGVRLLAHELIHTAQPGSDQRLARYSAPGVETKAVDFERSDIEKLTTSSYWEQKVMTELELTLINTVPSRFTKDTEERDATLSAAWARRPTTPLKTNAVVTVSIPARKGQAQSQDLLYQFTYTPAPDKKSKPGVQVDMLAEGAAAKVTAAPPPAAGFTPPTLALSYSGFPDTIDKYWLAHPEEHKQLYQFIENAPGPKFSQIVTTSETVKTKKHDSTFRVTGEKDTSNAKLTSLKIDLLGETPVFVETPSADYNKKDRADLELEKHQAKKKDKLGSITGVDTLPADEQLSVKYAIWQYFSGGTRNKEVDVVIPIAKKTTKVYYTIRFQEDNNVSVERVGEEDATVKTSPEALNISRVEGFDANSADAATFQTWVTKRYPSVTPKGTTLPELQDSVNKEMKAQAGTPEWFKKNYTMEVLDKTSAETRLQTVHGLASAETANMKAYDAKELTRLEFALETMSDAELQIAKDTFMARQKELIEIKKKVATPDPKTTGIARQKGSDRTITIFDSAAGSEDKLFAGGAGGVRPASVQTYVHELGHIFETKAALEAPFKKFVKDKKIKPITWYAGSKPATETFPEALAIYQTDPEWMKSNLPELFTWFEEVKKTGKPPKNP